MQEIQLRDAKACLSAIVDEAVSGAASVITRHGKREAVVIGYQEWLRLSQVPSFAKLLMLAPDGVAELAERDRTLARAVDL